MKITYEEPKMDILTLTVASVITTSLKTEGFGPGIDEEFDDILNGGQ